MNAKSRFDPAETEVSIMGPESKSEMSAGDIIVKSLISRYLRISLL